MRFLLVLLFSSLSCFFSHAQINFTEEGKFLNGNRNWAFGNSGGVTFNPGTNPTSFSSSLSSMAGAGSAAVSDRNTGDLLFYSDGVGVWNVNHQLMPNGANLSGTSVGSYFITSQGVSIIPFIGNEKEYYLFYYNFDKGFSPELYYSVVDMSLNNGLGDIDPNRKDILVHEDKNSFGEAMIAIPGDNCDIWLLTYGFENSEFKTYHISEKGFNDTAVLSSGGQPVQNKKAYEYGNLAISPDRSKIAFTDARSFFNNAPDDIDGVFIAKFDPATGKIANMLKFNDKNFVGGHGITFSPDNSKLYSFSAGIEFFNQVLFQFDVSNFDSLAIISSKKTIPSPPGMLLDQSLRRYGDTIYVSDFFGGALGAITKPNLSGAACNYLPDVISLSGGAANWGIGNDVVFTSKDTIATLVLDTFFCAQDDLVLEPKIEDGKDFLWDDGSTGSNRTINKEGTYWVSYQENICNRRIDTFQIEKIELLPEINVDVLKLGTTQPYDTYQWILDGELIQGAQDSILNVSKNGDYQVIVSDSNGCVDTSSIYKVTNADPNSIQDMNYLAESISVYPNPASDVIRISSPVKVHLSLYSIDGRMVQQVRNTKQIGIDELTVGVYFLHIYDKENNLIKVEKVIKK